jgi:hypothetical protein
VAEDEIRVVVFSNSTNVTIHVNGNVTGDMKFSRVIRENLSLFTLPFKVEPGEHHITFSGDWSQSLTFFVGDSVQLDLEDVPTPWDDDEQRAVICYVYWIALLIATFPVLRLGIGDRVNDWVNGNDVNGHIWAVVSFVAAPITIRSRLAKLPTYVQYVFFGLTLAPLFVPIFITILNGHVYIVFWGGYLINWRYSFDYDAQWYTVNYLGWVVLAFADALGHDTLTWTRAMAVDWLYCAWGLYAAFHVLDNKSELNGRAPRYASPLTIALPALILFWVIFYKWRQRTMAAKRENGFLPPFVHEE